MAPTLQGGGVSASPKGASLYKIHVINPETLNEERALRRPCFISSFQLREQSPEGKCLV